MRKSLSIVVLAFTVTFAFAQQSPTSADLADLEQTRQICSGHVKLAIRGAAPIYNGGWENCSDINTAWTHARGSGWNPGDQQHVGGMIARAPK